MSDPTGTLYDGDHTIPWQVGPFKPYWDPITRGKIYERKLRVREPFWAATPLDTVGPIGGNLVEESKPNDVGGDLVEWIQTYLLLPPSRTVTESVSYPFQVLVEKAGSFSLVEIPVTTTASVLYEYFHTTNPAAIAVIRAYRLVQVADNTFYSIGTKPGVGAQSIVVLDSQIRQVRGNFYERKTPSATPYAITEVTPS